MLGRIIAALVIPLLLIVSTVVVIGLGRGWRFNPEEQTLTPTGILVATSNPDGAQVFVDGKFTGATDSDIRLNPNWYDITISKEGYHDWKRKMRIQGEVVVKTDATLFFKSPSLYALTTTGVENPIFSPDGTKIAYIATPSASIQETGSEFEETLTKPTLFVYDFVARNLPFSKNPQPYTGTLNQLITDWEQEKRIADEVSLRKMPKEFISIASDSIKLLSFSPDETKVLYEATAAATLNQTIVPPLIGTREVEEKRNLEPGNYYVYDAKEDRNYNITETVGGLFESKKHTPTPTPTVGKTRIPQPTLLPSNEDRLEQLAERLPVFWLGTSQHLVLIQSNTIGVMEYDGSNEVTIYSGPFENGFVFPHPSGYQLIIMTNFNSEVSPIPTLYTLTIR